MNRISRMKKKNKFVYAHIYWGNDDFEVEWEHPGDGEKVTGRVKITKVKER